MFIHMHVCRLVKQKLGLAALVAMAFASSVAGNPILLGYAGARPGGLAPIDPSIIPTAAGVDTWVALAFAQDNNGDGKFVFYPGMTITPQQVAVAKQQGKKFTVSIAGEIHAWVSPQSTWQTNAISTLNTLIDTYGLDGIDLNYEVTTNNWAQFTSSWCPVFSTLKSQRPGLVFTAAPYGATAPTPYGDLAQSCPGFFSWINWQVGTGVTTNELCGLILIPHAPYHHRTTPTVLPIRSTVSTRPLPFLEALAKSLWACAPMLKTCAAQEALQMPCL